MLVSKTKYRAWFFTKEHGTFNIQKKKRFKPTSKTIKYNGQPYEPEMDNPSFSNGRKNYFFFEIGKKKQINTSVSELESEADMKDLLYATEIVRQIAKSITEKGIVLNWIHLVLTAFGCTALGWILKTYVVVPS